MDAPGASRTRLWSQPLPRWASRSPGIIVACIASGRNTSRAMSGWVPWNPAGVTPTTVNACVFSVRVEPTTSSRPPSRRCQKAWLTTATG